MKRILLSIILFSLFQASFSQDKIGKPFFTGSVNLSLGINENYVLFQPDDDEYLLDLTGLFLRTSFGYEFKKRIAVGFNVGLDYHWNYAVSAIPIYGSLRYSITEKHGDAFFIESSYGKMWRLSSRWQTLKTNSIIK